MRPGPVERVGSFDQHPLEPLFAQDARDDIGVLHDDVSRAAEDHAGRVGQGPAKGPEIAANRHRLGHDTQMPCHIHHAIADHDSGNALGRGHAGMHRLRVAPADHGRNHQGREQNGPHEQPRRFGRDRKSGHVARAPFRKWSTRRTRGAEPPFGDLAEPGPGLLSCCTATGKRPGLRRGKRRWLDCCGQTAKDDLKSQLIFLRPRHATAPVALDRSKAFHHASNLIKIVNNNAGSGQERFFLWFQPVRPQLAALPHRLPEMRMNAPGSDAAQDRRAPPRIAGTKASPSRPCRWVRVC